MSIDLLQIVPRLPPAVSGVGDYALLLAQALAVRGVQTHFINGDTDWQPSEGSVAPFSSMAVSRHSEEALREALEQASSCRAVLLHYVGYGYARRGCPFWLVRALEKWRRRARAGLIVLFHEVSGSGPVWTSGFWTSGIQNRLAVRLGRLADVRLVTTEIAARRLLGRLPAGTAAETLGVFSTLGESAAPIPRAERRRQMVVFGSSGWRREAYTSQLDTLAQACRCLEIERVVDIGVPVGLRPVLPVPFVETGRLAAREASDLMNHSTAGFFTYPIPHIGKSTIFAAYCAHALTPVTFAANRQNGDGGLRAGEHFLAGAPLSSAAESHFAAVAASAYAWYQPHRLEIHADKIQQAIAASRVR